MTRVLMTVICFLWLASSAYAQPLQGQFLTLIVEDNPPHAYKEPDTGLIEGIAVDIAKALLSEIKVDYELVMLPWNRGYRRALTERNTCIFPINYTDERKRLFQWVVPTQVGGWAIFQRPGGTIKVEQISDVADYELVGKISSPATSEIERIIGRRVLRTSGDEDSIQLLYRGRADLWISGVYDAPDAAQKMNMPAPELVLNWKPAAFGIGCSKQTNSDIVAALVEVNQKRLALLEKEGMSVKTKTR